MLTAKELRDFVAAADREGLCSALANLNEEEREALSDEARKLYDQVRKIGFACLPDGKAPEPELIELVDAMHQHRFSDWRLPRLTAGLARVGLCDKNSLEIYPSWCVDDARNMPQRITQILNDRRPPWLKTFVEGQLRNDRLHCIITWQVERSLIRSGALPEDNSDEFIKRMVSDFARYGIEFEAKTDSVSLTGSLYEELLADPDLLKTEVWRLFEVETDAFEGDWWSETILKLSEENHLDRFRLLEASAKAMKGEFRPGILSGFSKLHEKFKPTTEERERLHERYLALLDSKNSIVVGTALGGLELLTKARKLDASKFFSRCYRVFELDKKAPSEKTLKIAGELLKQNPASAPSAMTSLAHALSHQSPDVQEKACSILEKHRQLLTDEAKEELRSLLDYVAAVNRSRVERLLQESSPETCEKEQSQDVPSGTQGVPAEASPIEDNCGETAGSMEQMISQATKLPAHVREACGLEAVLTAVRDKKDPPQVLILPHLVTRCDASRMVKPLQELDELIFALSTFVEKGGDAIQIERIVDGMARFASDRPADFERKAAALKKRVLARSGWLSGTPLDVVAEIGFTRVLFLWLGVDLPERMQFPETSFENFVSDRMAVVTDRREKQPNPSLPLLALPTHDGGWIDPVVLVERIKSYEKHNCAIDKTDLAQALLRLAPDRRKEALKCASTLSDSAMNLFVRFALGEDKPLSIASHNERLALCSARSRLWCDPDSAKFIQFDIPTVRWNEEKSKLQTEFASTEDPVVPWELTSSPPNKLAISLAERIEGIVDPTPYDILYESFCMIWPANHAILYLMRLNFFPHRNSAVLKTLFDPDTTWTVEGTELATLATTTGDAEAKATITDLLVEAISDMRIDPHLLGECLARFSPHLVFNRVAKVLASVARSSFLHQWAIFGAIDAMLSNLNTPPHNLHIILEPYLESAVQAGKTPSEGAKRILRTTSGGKTGKLAKQLLALQPNDQLMKPICALALEGCIARAERWQRIQSNTPELEAVQT